MRKANSQEPICATEFLEDKSKTGRIRPWALHKLANSYISIAYEQVNLRKAERLRGCATFLEYLREKEGVLKLHNANFCRVRLCPICQWRRSLKLHGQMCRIMSYFAAQNKYGYLFLTLTMRNCEPAELSAQIDNLLQAWGKFSRLSAIKAAVKGWYRGLEVTHNMENDTFHPHLHCILQVNKSYFTSRDYLSHAALTALWEQSLGVAYTPIIDVRKVKGETTKAVSEAAKYTCKPSDIINFSDWDMTVDTVKTLDEALDKKRLIAFGGLMRKAHKELNLDNADDGDLLHTTEEGDTIADFDSANRVLYAWHTGYNQYVRDYTGYSL